MLQNLQVGTKIDRDEAIYKLFGLFGYKPFSVSNIKNDKLPEIATLVGLRTDMKLEGMRRQLGVRLTAMSRDGYRRSTSLLLGATVARQGDPPNVERGPEAYWIKQSL